MLVMIPITFLLSASKHSALVAFTFSVAIAIGITPLLLPVILSSSLGKGAIRMSKKKTIVTRAMTILNWYRFYRTIQLNVIIMSDNDWKSICPNELKNSIHTSCWCDVPAYYVPEKRLDDKYIPYDENTVRNIVDDISAQNFKHNLFLTYTT